MEPQELQIFFGYMALMNFGVLLLILLFTVILGKWVHKLHAKLFNISENNVGKTLYQIIAFYKISIFMFNVVPWLVLTILY